MITEIVLSFSNLLGFFLWADMSYHYEKLKAPRIIPDIFFLSLTASVFMHLSETKHGLKGIFPFHILSYPLLQIDRLFAILSGILFLYMYIAIWPEITTEDRKAYFMIGFFALFCQFTSEVYSQHLPFSYWFFVIFHLLWHFIAFFLFHQIAMEYLFYIYE